MARMRGAGPSTELTATGSTSTEDINEEDAMSSLPETHYKEGDRIGGFRIRRVAPIGAIRCVMVELVHERLGTPYLHLVSEDDNNFFSVVCYKGVVISFEPPFCFAGQHV